MHVPRTAKLQNHEEGNQNNLKSIFVQIIPPCFCLGVKINMSELMCFESLTSFHISFIFYQAQSPRKSTLACSRFIKSARITRVFHGLRCEHHCWEFSADKLCSKIVGAKW